MLAATSQATEKVLGRPRESSTAFPLDCSRENCSGKRMKLISGSDCSGKGFKLNSGSCYIPKDNIEKPMGEDAHFIAEDKCTIGVADGIGGWAKRGIDSGEYARQLMSNSLMAIHNQFPVGSVVDPKKVLEEAYLNTKVKGSSTACIITLTDQQCLHAANVGDSGFIIIRKGHTVYRSPVQQRCFNCPYQLGTHLKSDRPSSAEVIKVEIEDGDVIVAGSDGLFDNMFEKEIEETIMAAALEAASASQGGKGEVLEPQEVAWWIAELALYNSFDAYRVTPFQVGAEMAGKKHHGGKIDDITVIVSFVQRT